MVLRDTGFFDEVIPLLEAEAEGDPMQAATAYHDLAPSKRVTPDDQPLLDQMRALLQLTSLPDNYRLRVHYSLGKAHDDLGEYAEAVRHFDATNRLTCRTQKFDRAQFAAGSRRLAKSFTRDSSPANFMWSGLIHLVFPQARILHCRRNPVDTCLSNYFTNFSALMLFANSKADLAFYYRLYEALMAHWRSVLPPETLLDVDYEEMVAELEAMSRRIIDFVGLPWNDACLRPQDNQRAVKTASMWQARQPVWRTRELPTPRAHPAGSWMPPSRRS